MRKKNYKSFPSSPLFCTLHFSFFGTLSIDNETVSKLAKEIRRYWERHMMNLLCHESVVFFFGTEEAWAVVTRIANRLILSFKTAEATSDWRLNDVPKNIEGFIFSFRLNESCLFNRIGFSIYCIRLLNSLKKKNYIEVLQSISCRQLINSNPFFKEQRASLRRRVQPFVEGNVKQLNHFLSQGKVSFTTVDDEFKLNFNTKFWLWKQYFENCFIKNFFSKKKNCSDLSIFMSVKVILRFNWSRGGTLRAYAFKLSIRFKSSYYTRSLLELLSLSIWI